MASANLRILNAVVARAGGAWGQKTPSGGPDSSPRFFQDALEGALAPKTPSGSPLASPRLLGALTPRRSPSALASKAAACGGPGDGAAAEQLPRLLGRAAAALPFVPPRSEAKFPRVKFEDDPAMLAAEAKEAFLRARQRRAERRELLAQAGGPLRP
mmetsp:Transcript_13586/g.35959  ORF Transcript_13586/g.35959 Transcript_13586/m.35959 type:complete len:157 (+) Transcript_13586:83-553(+)